MADPQVLVWPADDGGTGWYRLRFPFRALAEQGANVAMTTTGPTLAWSERWSGPEPPPHVNAVALAERPPADVVVIQRPGRKWWRQVIPMLHAEGIAVVVDVDDRFDRIDPRNIAHPHFEMGESSYHSWRHIDACCRMADVVTASTPALAKRFGYGKGVVLPNLVPWYYLAMSARKRPRTVGWAGTMETHPGDLEVVGSGIRTALEGTSWHVHVVGTGQGVARALGVEAVSTTRDWVPFGAYPQAVASLEVGIVPLAPTVFNEAKSALKASEMAAVGVPVVMSPTPDNLRLHRLGVGTVARTPVDWAREVRRLIDSPELRDEMAETGRAVMATQTYEAHADLWWEAWSRAVIRTPTKERA